MNKYLTAFFDEKNLPFIEWELTSNSGEFHLISNEVVIEHIAISSEQEQKQISDVIRQIDFKNGDVNHFLKHLAGALINQ